jgi:Mrp family chromosome partitioning ATPase
LAKHLQFAAVQGSKVLTFVSSGRETGRTSVVLTLTRILALEGLTKVLLIDADRRHPDIATLTGQTRTPGLAEVLHGQAKPQQAIVPRTPGNVSSLTLGAPVSDVEWTKLVGPMRALIQQAKRNFDMVLIDAGVFGPDARLSECWLRGVADAVITVSRQLSDTNTNHDVLDWKQIGIESLGVIETFS